MTTSIKLIKTSCDFEFLFLNSFFFRSFSAQQAKHIRVGVNAFLDSIILCTETMQQFGPPAATYDYE